MKPLGKDILKSLGAKNDESPTNPKVDVGIAVVFNAALFSFASIMASISSDVDTGQSHNETNNVECPQQHSNTVASNVDLTSIPCEVPTDNPPAHP